MLLDSPKGNFKFSKDPGPVSFNCAAHPGYEIVHANFKAPRPMHIGFERIASHMAAIGRPISAVCGVELRIPRVLSPQEFMEFNRPYQKQLEEWGLMVNGLTPVARTNVANEIDRVPEPSILAFSYTAPSDHRSPSFVLAGTAEVAFDAKGNYSVIAPGDTSPSGLDRKFTTIIDAINRNMRDLDVSWKDATTVDLYTVHNLHELMAARILPACGGAGLFGLRWHFARPPVTGLELEIGVRGVRQELIIV